MEEDLFKKADFLNHIFDTVPSFLFVVDSDVRIFHLNAASLKLLGTDRNTVLMKRGGDALHCIHSREAAEGCGRAESCRDCVVRNSVSRVFRGEEIHREITNMKLLAEGKNLEVYLSVTATPLEYEGQKFALLIMEDITDLKKVEASLSRRTGQLEALNRELEAFSYSVAHDLRAPLRAISGFSNALIEDCSDGLDATARDYLARIDKAGRRMSELIDDLMKLSRLNMGGVHPDIVDMSALVREIVSELEKSLSGSDASFHIAEGVKGVADARLMRVVFENLLANACKFTAKTSPARIEFGTLTEDGKTVYFVRDNGAGFDMHYSDKLFNPFQRLHSSEEFPGSGIGLATARRIVHLHGGKIWAEGAPQKGATFFFSLNENR